MAAQGVGSGNCGKQIIDAGGKVLEILSDGTGRMNLESWITTYNLNVSSFVDNPVAGMAALKAAGIRETVFIVEMPSMKIAYVHNGDVTGISKPSIIAATAQMFTLMGKGAPMAPCM